jgi:two-component system response regulator YesN
VYTVLVVDDEPIIADGIAELVTSIDRPVFDVYTEYCGTGASKLINSNRIDILLTDICMPRISGLELQKQAAARWPDSKTVFLTGHADFEYVQEAVRNSAADYILKTEDEQRIIDSILRAVDEIERDTNQRYAFEEAQKYMSASLPVMQNELITEILDGWTFRSEELQDNLGQLHLDFDVHKPVLLVEGRVDSFVHRSSTSSRMRVVYGIQSILRQLAGELLCVHSALYERYKIVMLGQVLDDSIYGTERWSHLQQNLCRALERTQRKSLEVFKAPVSFVVHEEPVSWARIAPAFRAMDFRLNCRFKFAENAILHVSANRTEEGNGSAPIDELVAANLKKVKLLGICLECGQLDRFERLFRELAESVDSNMVLPSGHKTELYYSLATVFISYINRTNSAGGVSDRVNLDKLTRMDAVTSWPEVVEFFEQLTKELVERERATEAEEGQQLVTRVRQFVNEHLERDVSLAMVAKRFKFNASYFSRLFKSLAGETLSSYIARIRTERAEKLLVENRRKVSEISADLGFGTASYFTSFFKKQVGMTPKQYRERHLQRH